MARTERVSLASDGDDNKGEKESARLVGDASALNIMMALKTAL